MAVGYRAKSIKGDYRGHTRKKKKKREREREREREFIAVFLPPKIIPIPSHPAERLFLPCPPPLKQILDKLFFFFSLCYCFLFPVLLAPLLYASSGLRFDGPWLPPSLSLSLPPSSSPSSLVDSTRGFALRARFSPCLRRATTTR